MQFELLEEFRGDYAVTNDRSRITVDDLQRLLQTTSWAAALSKERIACFLEHSFNVGLFHRDRLIGYARVITDYCELAYLLDVVVHADYRKQGLGIWMLTFLFEQPALRKVRRYLLATGDAHDLYRKFGFDVVTQPDRYMYKRIDIA